MNLGVTLETGPWVYIYMSHQRAGEQTWLPQRFLCHRRVIKSVCSIHKAT